MTKNAKLRSRIMDLLKHLRGDYGVETLRRDFDGEKFVADVRISSYGITVSDLVDSCTQLGADPDKVNVATETRTYDDYPEEWIVLYQPCKETDEQWFDRLSNYAAPSYLYRRYKDWWKLKQEFEPS